MKGKSVVNFVTGVFLGIAIMGAFVGGGLIDRLVGLKILDRIVTRNSNGQVAGITRELVNEESTVTKVVEKANPSVVTITVSGTNLIGADPFDFFGGFFGSTPRRQVQKVEKDIGSGFIISSDGLIVTNKHVVGDLESKYKVVIGKDQVLEVKNIYRDPVNDLAILKVDKTGLTPVNLGDSDKLKVGQTVIAIGTALGEFRSTVTTGVISGIGRQITAGSPFEGSEKLEDVIQTDAAINPGNSGGPLFDSSGNVIGVNVAVSQSGQNIGFALPINIVKESIDNFKTTGAFDRPYLGVSYRMISRQAALMNEVPVGALVSEVISGSPAEKAGIVSGDIIVEVDGKKMTDIQETPLASLIGKKKIGDNVKVRIWREGKETEISVKLEKKIE